MSTMGIRLSNCVLQHTAILCARRRDVACYVSANAGKTLQAISLREMRIGGPFSAPQCAKEKFSPVVSRISFCLAPAGGLVT